MMITKEKGRRSLEEKRHGGCAEKKERTLAQQERRSGRIAKWSKTPSVRYPVRALPGKRRDWLQRQDSNLRHRSYEPRGMTASLRCGKTGAPSFCGLLGNSKEIIGRKLNALRPSMSKQNKSVSLRNYTASAAAILRIHPTIDPRDVLAGYGRHFLDANFGDHRLRWL